VEVLNEHWTYTATDGIGSVEDVGGLSGRLAALATGASLDSADVVANASLASSVRRSCTLHGRIYNLTTGEVTPVTISYSGSGRGKISAVIASSGEKISGEYLTFAHLPANWGSVYAEVYGTEGSAYTSGASLGKSNQ
jgi:hypothetical protein